MQYADREVITSRQNQCVVATGKLSEKKYRDKEKKFRIDGIKLLEEAVFAKAEIETVFLRQGSAEKILDRLYCNLDHASVGEIKILSDGVFDKLSEEKSPEGVICTLKYIDKIHRIVKIDNKEDAGALVTELDGVRVFAVESVRDPGNLGTMIRTAAAFGVDVLLLSNDCADIYNSKTVRAAMGALFRQRIIRVSALELILEELSLSGRKTFAATLGRKAVILGKNTLSADDCIVVGNEGHGLSETIINACDGNILIPMAEGAESLNAAVAASVCMWEQFGKKL